MFEEACAVATTADVEIPWAPPKKMRCPAARTFSGQRAGPHASSRDTPNRRREEADMIDQNSE